MSNQGHGPRRRLISGGWAKAAIITPILGTVLPFIGVRVVDYLFPQLAPSIDTAACSGSDERLGALEAKVEVLIRLYAKRGTEILHSQVRDDLLLGELPTPPERKERVIAVENTSVYIGRKAYVGQRAWDWTIYITADESVLEDIECVSYTLHPTFPNPVRPVCERGVGDKAFSLTSRGWGTFMVDVLVTFKEGFEQRVKHQLVFVPGK